MIHYLLEDIIDKEIKMNYTLRKNNDRQITLEQISSMYIILILILPAIYKDNIAFFLSLIYFAMISIYEKLKINRIVIRVILPQILLMFIGMITIFSSIYEFERRDMMRDFIYLIGPIIVMINSYYLIIKIKDIYKIIKIFFYSGFIVAIFHMIKVLPQITTVDSVFELRNISLGYDIVTLSLAIFIIFPNLIRINKLIKIGIVATLIGSTIISSSRTSILYLGIILIISIGISFRKKFFWEKSIKVIISTLIILITLFSICYLIGVENQSFMNKVTEIGTDFNKKILRTFEEIKIEEYNDLADINNNWRGYESYRALTYFKEGKIFQKILGYGFGALIPLNLYIELDGLIYNKVPIIHNGYIYILVKYGIIGLALYIIYFINMILYILKSKYIDRNQMSIKYIGISLVTILLLLTYTSNGIYHVKMLLPYLLLLNIIVFYFKQNKNRYLRRE